jgi:hypothetical protein
LTRVNVRIIIIIIIIINYYYYYYYYSFKARFENQLGVRPGLKFRLTVNLDIKIVIMVVLIIHVRFGIFYIIVVLVTVAVLFINSYWRRAWFYLIEACIGTCYYFVLDSFYKLSSFRCP